MKSLLRSVAVGALLILFVYPAAAQDDLSVVGSGVAAPLFDTLANAAEINLTTQVTGTVSGFQQFCAGEADVTLSTRPIAVSEEAACAENEIEFAEILMGYEALAFIVNPELNITQCLALNDLNSMLAPSATLADWLPYQELGEDETEAEAIAFAAMTTANDTSTYFLLDELIDGVGFRDDFVADGDSAAVAETVLAEANLLGIINAATTPEDVSVLALNSGAGCFVPSSDDLSAGRYPAGVTLYAYVNSNDLDSLRPAFDVEAEVLAGAGYLSIAASDEPLNEAALAGEVGRQFSAEVTAFTIPPTVEGTINIAGASTPFRLVDRAVQDFTTQYSGALINNALEGQPDGLRRLCNGEVDLVFIQGGFPADAEENCAANDITRLEIELGAQGAVLITNAAAEHLACLPTEQLVQAWAASEEPVMTWDMVDESYPETDVFVFAQSLGDVTANLMLTEAGSRSPLREDLQTNFDELFRAAAVANAEGAMSVMTWEDYQNVVASGQEGIQLVEVDAGDGCIAPTEAAILDGTYPLARETRLVISETALQRIEVQSFVWFMLDESRINLLTANGFIGFDVATLNEVRDTLQAAYEAATEAAAAEAEAAAEASAAGESDAAAEEPEDAAVENAGDTSAPADDAAEADTEGEEAAAEDSAADGDAAAEGADTETEETDEETE